MTVDLSGKRALVAGGARGIGGGIAAALAGAGATVYIGDIETETAREHAASIGGTALELDVTQPDAWQAAAAAVGELDILVYAAGIFPRGDIYSHEPEQWQQIQAVNCTGFYLACRTLIPLLVGRGGGSVIGIGSVMTLKANPGMAAYCVSKAGLAILCRSLARGHAADQVRVNCVNPGWVDSPGEQIKRLDEPDWKDRATRAVPLGRLQTPEELGAMCAFLCSDQAASITGQIIGVDGGLGI